MMIAGAGMAAFTRIPLQSSVLAHIVMNRNDRDLAFREPRTVAAALHGV